MNKNKKLTKWQTVQKIFMIIGIIVAANSTSQASEWNIIYTDLNGYNFYTNKFIKDTNL